MSNQVVNWIFTGLWGVTCLDDLVTACRPGRGERGDPLDGLGSRAEYPFLSLLSDSAGLVDSIGVSTPFFSGLRHATASILYVAGLVGYVEKISLLREGALLEEQLGLDGSSRARGRMLAPYMGLLFSISMLVFSILGIATLVGAGVSSSLTFGVGVFAAITYGVEYALKKAPLSRESYGTALVLT